MARKAIYSLPQALQVRTACSTRIRPFSSHILPLLSRKAKAPHLKPQACKLQCRHETSFAIVCSAVSKRKDEHGKKEARQEEERPEEHESWETYTFNEDKLTPFEPLTRPVALDRHSKFVTAVAPLPEGNLVARSLSF